MDSQDPHNEVLIDSHYEDQAQDQPTDGDLGLFVRSPYLWYLTFGIIMFVLACCVCGCRVFNPHLHIPPGI